MIKSRIEEAIAKLNRRQETSCFTLHYAESNPTCHGGCRPESNCDPNLVLTYLHALEIVSDIMKEPPWSRWESIDEHVPVYVLDIQSSLGWPNCPFTSMDENGFPYIVLCNKNPEPTVHRYHERASAESIHEATHVFNWLKYPKRLDDYGSWSWVDEGIAVYIEYLVMHGNPDYLRFTMNWCDTPQTPLNASQALYESFMFIRYLARRFGTHAVNELWANSLEQETPFQALDRMLPHWNNAPLPFSNPVLTEEDLFASGYCLDSYFLADPKSHGFAHDVYQRYTCRAETWSFLLDAGKPQICEDILDPLACHYFRLYPKHGVKTVTIQLQTPGVDKETSLKAEVAVVTRDLQKGNVYKFTASPNPVNQDIILSTAFPAPADLDTVDHLVLVVTNCGRRPSQPEIDEITNRRQEFKITVAAKS